jgi:uroporphyrinogen-III decarboxylase
VFNLGHGIGQTTPPEHVGQVLARVRDWRRT